MDPEYGALLKIEEVKASEAGWEVAGYVSTYGNVDLGGDVVMRGAFDQSLAEKDSIPLLHAHRTDQLLGGSKSLKSDDKGLYGTFSISKTQLGSDIHTLLKDGHLRAFSIGYLVKEAEFDDVGTRLLKQIDLLESSLVVLPMNERAAVTRVKADLPFDQLLAFTVEQLKLGVEQAEALHTRRASEKRELTERHVAAITALHKEVEASLARLGVLLVTPTADTSVLGDLKLRLELARHRLNRHGLALEAI